VETYPPEGVLEAELWANDQALLWPLIADALKAFPKIAWMDLKLSAWRQVPIVDAGICDILVSAVRRDTNELLKVFVIELKRIAHEDAIAQVLRYSGALTCALASYEIPVPIVAAYGFTPRALYARMACKVRLIRLDSELNVGHPTFPSTDCDPPKVLTNIVAADLAYCAGE
jgi:hypothetical protein